MSASGDLDAGPAGLLGLEGRATQFQGPLDRLLYLRLESQLASLSGHELALLAQHSEERYFEAGTALMRQGSPVPAVHFVVEGRVTMRRDGVTYRDMSAPAVVGLVALLSRDPEGVEVIVEQDTIALEVAADVMLDLVEDNFRFLSGAVRGISGQLLEAQQRLEREGLLSRSEPEQVPYPEQPLDLVQRLGMMRSGIYADVNLEPLVELIRNAEEVRVDAGSVLWNVGDTADFGIHVVYGVVLCEDEAQGRRFRMGPGSIVGTLEANAATPRSYRAVAETRLVVIRTRTDRFFDVLEDHTELGMGLLSALARHLIDLQVRLARSGL